MQPTKGWTTENVETYARFLAENYYIDEAGNREPLRSEADAYENWKLCAAVLGVSRTGVLEVPEEAIKRAEALREEIAQAKRLRAAAPELLAVIRRWHADLMSVNPEFNDPAANALMDRLGVDLKRTPTS